MKKKQKKVRIVWRILSIVPLVLAIAFLIYLRAYQAAVPAGYKYAPATFKDLSIAIIVFIVGYLLFLGIVYSEAIKNFFRRKK